MKTVILNCDAVALRLQWICVIILETILVKSKLTESMCV